MFETLLFLHVDAMSISELHRLFLESSGVCTDSRSIKENSLFFALKGASFNGNDFAQLALEQGANFAIVDEDISGNTERLIRVDNVLDTLQELASYHRTYLGIPILAITGTNGKTTTKELINAVLSCKYKITSTVGNLNNHIGVPLTLLSMNSQTQIGVVEMGANHPKEIMALCNIAKPNVGLITNVGKGHLEGFGSFDGVKKTKGELYDYLDKNGGQVFVLEDSEDLMEMVQQRHIKNPIAYGLKSSGVKVERKGSSPYLNLKMKDGELLNTHLIGTYNLPNILAAITVGNYFKVPYEESLEGIREYLPQNHRSQSIETGSNSLIMDAYNANPTSMRAAIENFSELEYPKKLLILGDMLELGKDSREEHEQILQLLKEKGLSNVYLVGREFSNLGVNSLYLKFEDVEQLCKYLENNKPKGNLILIKGSRSIHLERVLQML